MKKIIILLCIFICSCSKMEEKKTTDEGKIKTPNSQNTDSKDQTTGEEKSDKSGKKDPKAEELSKAADDALAKYSADKSNENKKDAIDKCMAAAKYIEFEAELPAREKYRPALKYYRKVLEMDPANKEAEKNKKEIEDIYTQMGMPIPQ